MLTHLYIKDLAIVTRLETDFGRGMTVLSGETGAGKSILIDGLGLALGERADKRMVRAGRERAEITAEFDVTSLPAVTDWLQEQALEQGTECILRRVLTRDGGSRAFINGTPVPIRSLQGLGDLLVDIHGQHAHQSLLHRNQQRNALDGYAGHGTLQARVEASYEAWQESHRRLTELRKDAEARAERIDLLSFQVNELDQANLVSGESSALDAELRRLSSADRLREGCGRLLSDLYEDEGAVLARLNHAASELREMTVRDGSLAGCAELIETAVIQVEEAVSGLRDALEEIESDPARLRQVEQRIGELQDLARKYRCKAGELADHRALLEEKLTELQLAEADLSELERQVEMLRGDFEAAALELHEARCSAGKRLSEVVTRSINGLGMPKGRFDVAVERLEPERAAPHGMSRVEFLVSANPGQPMQPLARVASGGELSRISLALQVATLESGQIPTLIFDEVDVGIGGSVAEIVGRLLRELGTARQVFCVTHLPQVAALGHQHLQITKQSDEENTSIDAIALDGDQRVMEIARMLGGIEITEKTRDHAREMLTGTA